MLLSKGNDSLRTDSPGAAQSMDPQENPYASPMADIGPPPLTPVELTRKRYLNHEVSVQSIGSLYYLGAFGTALMTLGMFGVVASGGVANIVGGIVTSLIFGVLTVFFILLGWGLQKLNPRVRIPVAILAGIGMLYIPIGTIINAYILYLVVSKKGRFVFSDEYKEVIRQTPHIRYRSWLAIVFLVLLLLILAAAVLPVIFVAG